MSNVTDTPDCSCDPYSRTDTCCVSCCVPFFSVFLVLEASVLLVLVVFYTGVEIKSQKKSLLWRLIFSSAIVSNLAKVLRLGMLLNPATRHKSSMLLLFFLNTHQCFGIIGFLSLVFFWARLRHDISVSTKGIYGKLLPVYVATAILAIVLYYAQLPIERIYNGAGVILNTFKLLSACVGLISAVAYVVYAILLWKTVLKKRDTHPLFYRIYISAFITAIFIVITALVVFITRFYGKSTVRDYFIRHSIYETCYFFQIAALPSGFIMHFIKSESYRKDASRIKSMTHPMTGSINQRNNDVTLRNMDTTTTMEVSIDTPRREASPLSGGEDELVDIEV